MPGVFVSHAHADEVLVGHFVDDVIRLGCGVPPGQLFYSSGEDTGVPSGRDLNAYVRDKVGEASIVVAVVSPAFQSRPFCVAELGAAWIRVGNLFPLAVASLARGDLDGVLKGMAVRYLNDGSALDELHDRISEAIDHATPALTWVKYRNKWLANVDAYMEALPLVRVVTAEELERVQEELDATRQALQDSETERRALDRRVQQLAEAKSSEDVREILLPEDEHERFQAITAAATDSLGKLVDIAAEAIWYELARGGMPWPDRFNEPGRSDSTDWAVDEGLLQQGGDELLHPDRQFADVEHAVEAAERLQEFLAGCSAEFGDWFRDEYGMPPDLSKRRVWDQLI